MSLTLLTTDGDRQCGSLRRREDFRSVTVLRSAPGPVVGRDADSSAFEMEPMGQLRRVGRSRSVRREGRQRLVRRS